MQYAAVDPAERRSTRARTIGLIALFAGFVVAMVAAAVLISPAWLQVAFAVLAVAGLAWLGLFVPTDPACSPTTTTARGAPRPARGSSRSGRRPSARCQSR